MPTLQIYILVKF